MDTKPIWDLLSSVSVGQMVVWILAICTIISALCAGTIKLYKIFTKYKDMRDKEEKKENIIEAHDKTLNEIKDSLQEIKKSLNEQKDVNLKQIRHTIVHTCEDAIDRREISINKLQSLEEMFDEYTEIFHGNGYVKTLVKKVRELPVVGNFDE